MNQDDYIILFDENGSPYIAHASWQGIKNTISNAASSAANAVKGVGRGVRQNHKYLLKVLENGKARYFYTQEEVKAYYNEKKKAANKAIEDATKKTKESLSKAKTDVSNKVKNGQAQYERMKNEFRERTGQAARDRRDEAEQKAETARRDEKRAEDRWWNSAKEAMARPTDKRKQRERDNMESMGEKTHQRYLAEDEARKARIEYSKTPLGKAEKKAEEIKGNIKDILGYDERSIRDSTQARVDERRANGEVPTIRENTNAAQAQKKYNRTPLGMIENARKTANAAAESTKETASKVVTKAKETASSAADTAKDMLETVSDATKETANKVANSRAVNKAKEAASSAKDMVDEARTALADRKKAINADEKAEQFATRAAALTNSLNNHRKNYANEFEDKDHTYRDGDGYYYKTEQQRDYANQLRLERAANERLANTQNSNARRAIRNYSDSLFGKAERDLLGSSFADNLDRGTADRDIAIDNARYRQKREADNLDLRQTTKAGKERAQEITKKYQAINDDLAESWKNLEGTLSMYSRVLETNGANSSAAKASEKLKQAKLDAYKKELDKAFDAANRDYNTTKWRFDNSLATKEEFDAIADQLIEIVHKRQLVRNLD